jgi:hypothetical protein
MIRAELPEAIQSYLGVWSEDLKDLDKGQQEIFRRELQRNLMNGFGGLTSGQLLFWSMPGRANRILHVRSHVIESTTEEVVVSSDESSHGLGATRMHFGLPLGASVLGPTYGWIIKPDHRFDTIGSEPFIEVGNPPPRTISPSEV